jgi:hypothetical protein
MEQIRLISASLQLSFSSITTNESAYNFEFESLSELERDPIGQWYKKQKAKGEIDKQNETLITLLIELHRKVDDLSRSVAGDTVKLVELDNTAMIDSIGYDYFSLSSVGLNSGIYYGRMDLPIFPEKLIPLYFEIIKDGKIAKIIKMHGQDHTDWDSFVIAKERQHIQDAKDVYARNENI